MRIPSQEWIDANLGSAFDGAASAGLAGSMFGIATNQHNFPNGILGSGPSLTSNAGGGGYSGGGQSPGSGAPGGADVSTGGSAGTAGGNMVGGQDPGNLASPLLPADVNPPPDNDDDYDDAADYSDWSGLGTGITVNTTQMPVSMLNGDTHPQPLPGALLGCSSCLPCAGSSAGSAALGAAGSM